MLLFEEFKYDEEWAKANYGGNIRNSWSYLSDILDDYKFIQTLNTPEERQSYMFQVSRSSQFDSISSNVYEIQEYYGRQALTPLQVKYITNRLKVLGDAVKILSTNYNGHMLISYDISKDEYRWNLVHQRIKEHDDALNSIEIQDPEMEDWTFMITSYYGGKNPRIIFKKICDKDKLLRLYIIACKLGWNAAKMNIKTALVGALREYFEQNNLNKHSYDEATLQCEACEKYAKTYELSEDVQLFLDMYKDEMKSTKNIPVKAKPIAALLEKDAYIKSFTINMPRKNSKYDPLFEIKINTADDHEAWIVVKYYDQTYCLYAYKTIETITKYGTTYIQFKDQINKHIYMTFKLRFGKTHVNATLQNLLDTYWNMLMDDIKEYFAKEK